MFWRIVERYLNMGAEALFWVVLIATTAWVLVWVLKQIALVDFPVNKKSNEDKPDEQE